MGGHFEDRRALAGTVAVVSHNPEAIFGVWHEVLDGDLHLPGTAGVYYSLPDVDTHTQTDKQRSISVSVCHLFVESNRFHKLRFST